MYLIALDIDGTQFDKDDPAQDPHSRVLKTVLESLVATGRAIIVHNTGRPYPWRCDGDIHERYLNPIIARPHAIIHTAGTQIATFPDGQDKGQEMQSWSEDIASRVSDKKMHDLKTLLDREGLTLHPESFANRYKISCIVHPDQDQEALRESVQGLLDQAFGPLFEVFYWQGSALDITPKGANKNDALQYMAQRYQIPVDRIIVAGDSMNDLPVLENPDLHRIVVGNAVPFLKTHITGGNVLHCPSDRPAAAGVLFGLEKLGVIAPDYAAPKSRQSVLPVYQL